MMNLDEAIKREEETTNMYSWGSGDVEKEQYHRQLAEWLRELKAYREQLPKEIKNVKVRQAYALEANVNNENYNSHLAEYIKGYLCGLSYTEGIIAKIIEEENDDEN